MEKKRNKVQKRKLKNVFFTWWKNWKKKFLLYDRCVHFSSWLGCETFSFLLLIGNHMAFLFQLRIYLHSWIFQKLQIALAYGSSNCNTLWKIFSSNKFQIELEVIKNSFKKFIWINTRELVKQAITINRQDFENVDMFFTQLQQQ